MDFMNGQRRRQPPVPHKSIQNIPEGGMKNFNIHSAAILRECSRTLHGILAVDAVNNAISHFRCVRSGPHGNIHRGNDDCADILLLTLFSIYSRHSC